MADRSSMTPEEIDRELMTKLAQLEAVKNGPLTVARHLVALLEGRPLIPPPGAKPTPTGFGDLTRAQNELHRHQVLFNDAVALSRHLHILLRQRAREER